MKNILAVFAVVCSVLIPSAKGTTLSCTIYTADPSQAKTIAVGTLVKNWSGKLFFVTERSWSHFPAELEIHPVCNGKISAQAGDKFLYYSLQPEQVLNFADDDSLLSLDSSEAKEVLKKFSKHQIPKQTNPAWQFCDVDEDCIKVYDQCQNPARINKAFEKEFSNFSLSQKGLCTKTNKDIDSDSLECLDHFCSKSPVRIRTIFGYRY